MSRELQHKQWQVVSRSLAKRPEGKGASSLTPDEQQALEAHCGGSRVLVQLLVNRGIATPQAAEAFLVKQKPYTPTPGWCFPGMQEAVDRVKTAIEQQQHILIYGDFDVDGQTGTAILLQTLQALGANVSFYIPDRATEGHGLNASAACRLVSARKVKLLITTDTGIGNFNEISLLKGLGVDTIVTDHHENPENLPPSLANITPKCLPEMDTHPLGELSGAGVAYKFCVCLMETLGEACGVDNWQHYGDDIIDLAAIGMVCDVMPMVRENRDIVNRGLEVLNRRGRLGLVEILAQAGVEPEKVLDSESLGFVIGPRLNAIGRLDKALDAVELLTTKDVERARSLAMRLEQLNKKRQELCDKTMLEAEQFINASGGLGDRLALALASPSWHPGIIGIVASRLVEKYNVPTFLMVADEAQNTVRGSARSIQSFEIHTCLEAVQQEGQFFKHYGGHAGAGGFALPLDKLDGFRNALYRYAEQALSGEDLTPTLRVECPLQWSQVNLGLLDQLETLAPFGPGNPDPLFLLESVKIGARRSIGQDGKHLKLMLQPESPQATALEGLLWFGGDNPDLMLNEHAHFVVKLMRNTFGNKPPTVQLQILDYQLTAAQGNTAREKAAVNGVQPSPATAIGRVLPRPASGPVATSTTASTASAHAAGEAFTTRDTSQTPMQQAAEQAIQRVLEKAAHPCRWVDHRNRESMQRFLGQLSEGLSSSSAAQCGDFTGPLSGKVAGVDTSSGTTDRPLMPLIYNEGRKPQLPVFSEEMVRPRTQLAAHDTLILWDLPPDVGVFRQLLETVQPQVLHIAGGKYQSAPLYWTAEPFLKGFLQLLQRYRALGPSEASLASPNHVQFSLDDLTIKTAASVEVVLAALSVLEQYGLAQVSQWNTAAGSTEPMAAYGRGRVELLLHAVVLPEVLPESAAVRLLNQQLQRMGQFRQWLLSADLEAIRAVVLASPLEADRGAGGVILHGLPLPQPQHTAVV